MGREASPVEDKIQLFALQYNPMQQAGLNKSQKCIYDSWDFHQEQLNSDLSSVDSAIQYLNNQGHKC